MLMDNWEMIKEQKIVVSSAEDNLANITSKLGEIDSRKGENEERFENY